MNITNLSELDEILKVNKKDGELVLFFDKKHLGMRIIFLPFDENELHKSFAISKKISRKELIKFIKDKEFK